VVITEEAVRKVEKLWGKTTSTEESNATI
jgi:hypothetical protein